MAAHLVYQNARDELLNEAMAEPGLTPDDGGYVEIAESLAKLFMRRSLEMDDLVMLSSGESPLVDDLRVKLD